MVSIQRLLFALAAAAPAASALQMSAAPNSKSPGADTVSRRGFLGGYLGVAAASAALVGVSPSVARAEYKGLPEGRSVPADQRERGRGPAGVNKPELLPEGPTRSVIDLEKFMVPNAVNRLETKIKKLGKQLVSTLSTFSTFVFHSHGLCIYFILNLSGSRNLRVLYPLL